MRIRYRTGATLVSVLFFPWLGLGPRGQALVPPTGSSAVRKQAAMTRGASGTFEVQLTPTEPNVATEEGILGRMSIDKRFMGELDAIGKGEMLTAVTGVEGSAGYVAMERVSGVLQGRRGSFVLQHSGIMNRGEPQLTITVVPDSGTGELVGLSGRMIIDKTDGTHAYEFEYTLPEVPH